MRKEKWTKIVEYADVRLSNKDYSKSDELRDKITSLGYTILDKPKNEYEIIKK